jgi:hypothetical protein
LFLSQLGVNNQNSIINGNLAGKYQFFGSSTAEVVSSTNNSNCCSWNGDYASSVNATNPWSVLGGRANETNNALPGTFAFYRYAGGAINNYTGHRTILSGY